MKGSIYHTASAANCGVLPESEEGGAEASL